MRVLLSALLLMFLLGACAEERTGTHSPPSTQQPPSETAQAGAQTSTQSDESAGDPVDGVWSGQVEIDAHAGVANLNYVGAE
ncbi:MAG TPA: hypothetical protein VHL59_17020, partial [Thermoanaerobaculia bacterium]|nr:hypothetical protein [Thermoanaerobaculia bacterium]